jgi:arsenite methyltransferase
MINEEKMKKAVQEKYGQIARSNVSPGCCSDNPCGSEVNLVGDDYQYVDGYVQEADLGLGCGLPTQYAQIHPGAVVVDLGSGAGNDVFIARNETGPRGRVVGIDFTPEMIEKARANLSRLGYDNVEFKLGEIEDIPLDDESADIVVSNCVFNLVTDKEAAFNETFRILRPGGHFSISDVVSTGVFPEELRYEAALYTGCISGALPKDAYIELIKKAGFINIDIRKEQKISIPEDLMDKYISPEEKRKFDREEIGMISATFYAEKPLL